MAAHPFCKSLSRFRSDFKQFNLFKTEAGPEVIARFANKIGRFALLEKAYGKLRVTEPFPETLQIEFGGPRPTGRKNEKGGIVSELGPSLVYSLGPTGAVAAIMYPAKSDFCRPREASILLRMRTCSWYPLYKKVPGDLRALAAYGHVTSLDGDPTLFERALIWWLRRICPNVTEDAPIDPRIGFGVTWATFKLLIKYSIDAVFKPLVLAAFILLFIHFGYSQLANFLRPHSAP
jgi:hypothetical protein